MLRRMPILKGAVTLARFRVETEARAPADWKKQLGKTLRLRAFEPLRADAPEERAQGFVELADKESTDFSAGSLHEGEWALFSFRIDEVRIPSSVVKAELEKWVRRFQAENERLPGKREKTDAKAEIRHTLRARYPINTKTFDVSWNLDEARLQVWAASRKAIEEVTGALEQAFKVRLVPVVPVTVAARLGIPEKALAPTPALSMTGKGDKADKPESQNETGPSRNGTRGGRRGA